MDGPVGSTPLFRLPWFYMVCAGLSAPSIVWILTDGVGYNIDRMGDGRSEVVAIVMICSIGALLAAVLSSIEHIVSGNWVGGLARFLVGVPIGVVGAVVFAVIAGVVTAPIQDWQADIANRTGRPSVGLHILWRTVAWSILGGTIGAVTGAMALSWRKTVLGLIGGTVGGLVGGVVFDPICLLQGSMEVGGSAALSRLIGFGILGSAIGLGIAIAEEAAKSAWVKIEAGRLIGKQFIIYRNPTRIGAAPSSDIYLFKDPSVLPSHARIDRRSDGCWIVSEHGAAVQINGRSTNQARVRNGDLLKIGETLLRFGERRVRA